MTDVSKHGGNYAEYRVNMLQQKGGDVYTEPQ